MAGDATEYQKRHSASNPNFTADSPFLRGITETVTHRVHIFSLTRTLAQPRINIVERFPPPVRFPQVYSHTQSHHTSRRSWRFSTNAFTANNLDPEPANATANQESPDNDRLVRLQSASRWCGHPGMGCPGQRRRTENSWRIRQHGQRTTNARMGRNVAWRTEDSRSVRLSILDCLFGHK